MSLPIGVTLRLLGPLVEVACLAMLRQWGGRDLTVAGVPVEYPLYGGMALGLAMVVAGLTWFRARRPDAGDRP